MTGVPVGWELPKLGAIADFVMGQAPPGSASNFDGRGMPFVKAGEFGPLRPIIREWTTEPLKCARETDVLICVVGATCGKINLGADCAIGRSVAAIRPCPGFEQHYLHYFLATLTAELRNASTGSAQGVISSQQLAEIEVPLAPLVEQRRIVAKLDALTARTASARAELDRVPALVGRYKKEVLRATFDGVSTVAAANASQPWPRKRVSEVIENVVAGKNLRCQERPPNSDELGVVKVSAVTWGRFDPTASKTLPRSFIPPAHTRIRGGDFLLSRANTLELVGAVVIVDDVPDNLYLSDKILRLEMPEDAKPWLMWFMRSPQGRSAIENGATGNQLSMRNISQAVLGDIEVPWPEDGVRDHLVARLESSFAEIDRLAAEAAAARRLLERLDQAILAKAFRGELVPQDPAAEPASALLARISDERAGGGASAKRGRRKALA